jgi:hypothetical protein
VRKITLEEFMTELNTWQQKRFGYCTDANTLHAIETFAQEVGYKISITKVVSFK